jgi:hypothetical protein
MRPSGVGRVTALALIAASLLLGFLASAQVLQLPLGGRQPSSQAEEPVIGVKASVPLGLHARIEAYKNGGLVFAKDGDPWTLNLAKLIKFLMFTMDGADWPDVRPTAVQQPNKVTTITTVMTSLWYRRGPYGMHVPVVGIGSGTAPPSVNDVSLQSTITLYDVVDAGNVAFQDAGSFYWLNITGQFTGLAVTVGEVGLFRRVVGATASNPPDQQFLLLLARDLVSPPITLVADDVLVVKYAIRVSKDVLVRFGLCDLVQVVFGLGDVNLRASYPCPRTAQPGNANFPAAHLESGSACTGGINAPCVKAVFATASITYTDRFALTTVPSGTEMEVRSPLTTITTNSTHLIIKTALRLGVSSTTTFYGLVFYRSVFFGTGHGSGVATYTAFTTRVVTWEGQSGGAGYAGTYPLMFIPFNPPLAVPAGSKVQVTLELAIPIA